MAWWAYLYVGFLCWVGVESVRGSARRHGTLATVFEVITSVAWPFLVLAYFNRSVGDLLGSLALPLYAVAMCWTFYSVWRDYRPSAMRPQLTWQNAELEYRVALIFAAVTVVPVLWLGAIVASRYV